MNNYCQSLNLSIFPLNEVTRIFDTIKKAGHCPLDLTKNINPKLIELLQSIGVYITYAEAFYRGPNSRPLIHSDQGPGDYVKINWIFGGQESTMQWFTVNSGVQKEITENTLNTSVCLYNQSEVTLDYEESIHSPSIVQVGSPHNIINPIEDRICISVIIADKDNKRLTMYQAKKALAVFID
jgi:hypothetical protein